MVEGVPVTFPSDLSLARAHRRVAIVTHSNPEVGGMERSFARLSNDLSRLGWDASAVVLVDRREGVTVDYLTSVMPTRAVHDRRQYREALAGADLVHVHVPTALLWSPTSVLVPRMSGIPTVVTIHLPSHPEPPARWRGRARMHVTDLVKGCVLRRAAVEILAPSSAAAAEITSRFRPWRLPVSVAENGVPDAGGSPVDATGPLRLVFVGRLNPHKRPLDFIACVGALTRQGVPVVADVVGQGAMRAELERVTLESALSASVRFRGFQADPARFIRAADALVLTSFHEGGALVMMEAASAGRVTVCRADLEGIPADAGAAVCRIDPQLGVAGFADALARLALNRELLIEAGAAARQLWESRYSVEAAAARLADVYERVSA